MLGRESALKRRPSQLRKLPSGSTGFRDRYESNNVFIWKQGAATDFDLPDSALFDEGIDVRSGNADLLAGLFYCECKWVIRHDLGLCINNKTPWASPRNNSEGNTSPKHVVGDVSKRRIRFASKQSRSLFSLDGFRGNFKSDSFNVLNNLLVPIPMAFNEIL